MRFTTRAVLNILCCAAIPLAGFVAAACINEPSNPATAATLDYRLEVDRVVCPTPTTCQTVPDIYCASPATSCTVPYSNQWSTRAVIVVHVPPGEYQLKNDAPLFFNTGAPYEPCVENSRQGQTDNPIYCDSIGTMNPGTHTWTITVNSSGAPIKRTITVTFQ